MLADSHLSKDSSVFTEESSPNGSPTHVDPLPPLLPRSAWSHQVAFLRVLFRAKKALDRIEKEAGALRSSS